MVDSGEIEHAVALVIEPYSIERYTQVWDDPKAQGGAEQAILLEEMCAEQAQEAGNCHTQALHLYNSFIYKANELARAAGLPVATVEPINLAHFQLTINLPPSAQNVFARHAHALCRFCLAYENVKWDVRTKKYAVFCNSCRIRVANLPEFACQKCTAPTFVGSAGERARWCTDCA